MTGAGPARDGSVVPAVTGVQDAGREHGFPYLQASRIELQHLSARLSLKKLPAGLAVGPPCSSRRTGG
jgi:hypothetical protein